MILGRAVVEMCESCILRLAVSVKDAIALVDFFFTATATTEIYTLSLHDALPIWSGGLDCPGRRSARRLFRDDGAAVLERHGDRKSTRLNSSHMSISYAVFCLKKKKKNKA